MTAEPPAMVINAKSPAVILRRVPAAVSNEYPLQSIA